MLIAREETEALEYYEGLDETAVYQ